MHVQLNKSRHNASESAMSLLSVGSWEMEFCSWDAGADAGRGCSMHGG